MNNPKYRKVYGGDGQSVTPRVDTRKLNEVKNERSVEETLTPAQLLNLHRSIHFTHQCLHNESMAKIELPDL